MRRITAMPSKTAYSSSSSTLLQSSVIHNDDNDDDNSNGLLFRNRRRKGSSSILAVATVVSGVAMTAIAKQFLAFTIRETIFVSMSFSLGYDIIQNNRKINNIEKTIEYNNNENESSSSS